MSHLFLTGLGFDRAPKVFSFFVVVVAAVAAAATAVTAFIFFFVYAHVSVMIGLLL